ncbi:hypothetical protein BABINDRAFT_158882 [Babjeviella inositovora NRRL Y-12698]|uniref:Serine/threonine-protein kinase n=1 Tax=Babjeviella inositovora NRRL Y-12698 TaxID=984486 RepID=A0A1E3QYS3_9ASCO|nr:uncharacterized protein BABINDRAFT_158882 [Babjeviella inositovora NRRL Y-12698]ODQ82247.1 hypothetical protein BABINDRAFT_158882 [Babjeviella inositovora NRRL Y-12698]
MASYRTQPLQPLNNGQLNARLATTPVKSLASPAHAAAATATRRVRDGAEAKEKPKKKEKLSSLCKTPPSIVRTRNGRDYQRGLFLGEGGFARCFQMKDSSGQIFAAKTVAKASIKNEKTKTKLLSEIKIHKSLKHPNIVNFIDCFEDDVNVYILLEICPHQSLMELLKTRKVLTEPETRFFMTQVVGAIKYLHGRRVIHRDLKLGNIFFDPNMNLKIGDFGLASVLPAGDSRKYTICGTPNYIAPEVLGGKTTGHSFEVDIWAIGVMMYALLVGKPPFQSRDVQVIYERIKNIDFAFPPDKEVSPEAKALIKDLLSLNPLHRPTIDEILQYDWFKGPIPSTITPETLVGKPRNVDSISRQQASVNFNHVKANAGIYSPSNKAPVQILKSDLESEKPKALLPQSLSPGDTKYKYKEVDPKQVGKPRRVFNTYIATTKDLDQNCFDTYQNMRKIEHLRDDRLGSFELPTCEKPVLVSKWVDYSNKYGFSYQLSTNDIGVLFNDENTVLKFHNSDKFLELILNKNEGWIAIENSSVNPPSESRKQLDIVDFFAKYMNSNLSKVSDNEERKETVFLRRYTRTNEYIMFELTDGSFQFNFKDHHKFCISKAGTVITHVSPNRGIETCPLILILKQGNFSREEVPECLEKIMVVKDAIKRKAFRE